MTAVRIRIPNEPPRLIRKESPPDLRVLTVVPLRAATDRRITGMAMRVLMLYGAYSNKAALTWVGQSRLAEHLGVSVQRICNLTKQLERLGYIKTVHKGFKGERADTRQLIFKEGITPSEAAHVSGDKAPYMIEQEARKRRLSSKSKVNDSALSNLDLGSDDAGLVESNEQMTKLSQIDPAYVQLAREHVGTDATEDQLLAAIDALLR